ncbi:hypothetical protein [Photobacterium swingsii]|uniref:hypothetical protein n=1 Tax=Photobacterium swingsii TaxID=680026 RepID=UPI004068DA24
MKAKIYKNRITTIPNFIDPLHELEPNGYGYQIDDIFVHVYGQDKNLYTLSHGLTVTEQINQSADNLTQWIENQFGAVELEDTLNDVGTVIDSVWRPGLYLYNDVKAALSINEHEQRSAELSLRILIEKLEEVFLYIEPSVHGLQTYSHKTRELLLLACTEVENSWKNYLELANVQPRGRYFSTSDYVSLMDVLFLNEYQVTLKAYNAVAAVRPFENWSAQAPSQSIPWYEAYNLTKHDKSQHFDKATLHHCISAITANLIMYCCRYSPFPLVNGNTMIASLFNQLFQIELVNADPKSFYVPKIQRIDNLNTHLQMFDSKRIMENWQKLPFCI